MLNQYILLAITIIVLAFALFIGEKVFGNRKVKLTGSYFLMAILVAVVILVLLIVSYAVSGFFSFLPGISGIGSILGFILSAYAVKSLLMKSASYERAVWVTLVAFLVVFLIEGIASLLGTSIIVIIA